MKQSSPGFGLYVLLLLLGAAAGLIVGGEVIRHAYGVGALFGTAATGNDGASSGTAAPPTPSTTLSNSRENAIVDATRMVAPCVVGIVVTQIQVVRSPYYTDDFFDFFFGPDMLPRYRQVESMGSGFVIRERRHDTDQLPCGAERRQAVCQFPRRPPHRRDVGGRRRTFRHRPCVGRQGRIQFRQVRRIGKAP